MLAKLCNILVKNAMGLAGMLDIGAVAVLPVATGLALTLTLLALKAQRPATARYEERPGTALRPEQALSGLRSDEKALNPLRAWSAVICTACRGWHFCVGGIACEKHQKLHVEQSVHQQVRALATH